MREHPDACLARPFLLKLESQICFGKRPLLKDSMDRIKLRLEPFEGLFLPAEFGAEKASLGGHLCAASRHGSDIVGDGRKTNASVDPISFAEDGPQIASRKRDFMKTFC